MGRKIKQVYFSKITEKELIEKAEGVPNFSKYVKNLMQRELFIDDIRSMLQIPISKENKPDKSILDQFI